jgi:hypothetical protein
VSPLLSGGDLDDAARFVTVRGVPVLDSHDDDDERGVVDVAMLNRIAKNSNKRAEGGDPPGIILGHSKRKQTVIVVRPDGSKTVHPSSDEEHQPLVVGYSSRHVVKPYKGVPTLHADFHIHKEHSDKAKTFPWRSVERVEPGDYIDRIALLRTPPQRDLGTVIHYSRSGSPFVIHYCKCPSSANGPENIDMSAIDDRIHDIVGAYFQAHFDQQDQRKELKSLCDQEGVDLDDGELEEYSSLHPNEFAAKAAEIRKSYARRSHSAHGPVMGRFDPGKQRYPADSLLRRATAVATRDGISYDAALAKLRSAP